MRLFIALTLPPEALDALTALQARLPSGRLVEEDNLHLTLAFLGERGMDEAEAVTDALDALRAPAVTLSLSGPALFGGRKGQALGLAAEGDAALAGLQARVTARLRGAGLTLERRRFRPHVTLARLRGGADASAGLAALAGARAGPFNCTGFALIESHLRPDGPIYEPLATWPLG